MRLHTLAALLLLSTSTPVVLQAQQATSVEDVVVLDPEDALPDSAIYMDKVNIVDKGFKVKCSYEQTLLEAKVKTVREKGNVLKVSKWITPTAAMSTCYGIRGDAYYVADIGSLKARQAARADSVLRNLVPDTARYAMLYIYRPSGYGYAISYNVHFGDSIICRVRNNSYFAIPIRKEGPATIWTRTEARVEVPVDIKFGQAYFLKCGVAMGALVGRPTARLLDATKGIREFRFELVEEAQVRGESLKTDMD